MIGFTKYLGASTSLILILITCTFGEYDTREVDFNNGKTSENNAMCVGTNCVKRAVNGVSGAMWFGPRLGRRRRSDEKFETDLEEASVIADVLSGAPWALVSVPAEKRNALFIPRLGRELGEDYPMDNYSVNNDGQDRNQNDVEQRQLRFPPRLGRHVPFKPSPRLGRQLQALLRKV